MESRWLLFIHHLPPTPAYLRVKVRRRLEALGAVALKPSVYALPHDERRLEEAEWLRREIGAGGGEGVVCAATLVGGLSDAEVVSMFARARDADYQGVIAAARSLNLPRRRAADALRTAARRELARLRARFTAICAIDYFGAPLRGVAEAALHALEGKLGPKVVIAAGGARAFRRGAIWVTRAGVHVDRIASAWLILRFLDPRAKLRFVNGREHVPGPREIRFDMVQAEFGHEGDECTFEVLLRHSRRRDPALRALAAMVHDIDLRDDKFQRPETAGFERVIAGICLQHAEDVTRIARGSAVLDDLYASLLKGDRP